MVKKNIYFDVNDTKCKDNLIDAFFYNDCNVFELIFQVNLLIYIDRIIYINWKFMTKK